jgi:single-strand DNA-binding protein
MKVGIEVRIDVKKIEKARLYAGQKGTYLTMTTFVDLDNQDEYGNNGFISHKKEQHEQGNTPILGNTKVFWSDQQQAQQAPQQAYQQPAPQRQAPPSNQPQGVQQAPPAGFDDFDDDIPF